MKKSIVFIKHMRDSIEEIESFIEGVSEEDFLNNKEKQNAVIRSIEVLGEAAKNVSEDIRKKYPKIEWKKISGMRDKLIHHYFGINEEIIWDAVHYDLPKLKKEIKLILKKEDEK